MRENERFLPSGWLVLFLAITAMLGSPIAFKLLHLGPGRALLLALIEIIGIFLLAGFIILDPNEARVLQFFGRYVGTAKQPGLRWTNPFNSKRKVSLRARVFESQKLKVNDADGSPIDIAAVVVWRVVDTARAVFEVDDYNKFVTTQTEASVRDLAMQHPYDGHDDTRLSLRGSTEMISAALKIQIQSKLSTAGVEVMEARISHLAYAQEIAQAMLRRQQAGAVVAARQKIVEGAVGMVEHALTLLSERKVVNFDDERKAAMVSNLLVVLCGEHEVTPIVNTGTIYQ
jgi:hypothetical protein